MYYARAGRVFLQDTLKAHAFADLALFWDDLPNNAILAGSVLGCADSMPTDELRREAEETAHFILRWVLHGGNANFVLSHGLATSLLLTDCAKLPSEEVRWPFPSFVVTLPYPESPISITSREGDKIVPVRWIQFHQLHLAHADDQDAHAAFNTRYSAAMGLYARDARRFRDAALAMKTVRDEASLTPMTVVRLLAEDGLSTFRREPWPTPGESLEGWIGGTDEEFAGMGLYALTDIDRHAAKAASRLLANLALYISEYTRTNPTLFRKWEERKKAPLSGRNPLTTYPLGAEVKLPKEMRDAASAFAQKGSSLAAWKLKAKHVVRGHWKEQPKGPHRAQRERIWIAPYWRGPDTVTATRTYTVAAKKEKDDEGNHEESS